MTIYSKFYKNGVEVIDVYNYQVNKTLSDNNSTSEFTAKIENIAGRNATTFNVNDEITVYADKDVNPPTTKIFTGIIENQEYDGVGLDEKIVITGRDYGAVLIDRTVEPEVYTNWDVGSIVRDIAMRYTSGITYSNVGQTGNVLSRIAFNQKPVYDAYRQLADLCNGYSFYVDENKDLHFEVTGSVSSNYILSAGSNVLEGYFKVDRESMYNQVWVYGDRYLDGYKETTTAGSPLGGSIFNLTYNPYNTEVTVSGATIQPGAIFNQNITPASGTRYLIDFDGRRIIFTSGTNLGANIPTSGNQVIINYKRSLPIVQVGDNDNSINTYGQRVKVIQDKDIKDPITAKNFMTAQLNALSTPLVEGNLDIKGIVNLTPGKTVQVNLPNHNVINQIYDVIETKYDFNKENNLSERVCTVKINQRIGDVTDTLKQMILDIKKIQGGDISNTDIITRTKFTTGSIGVRTSGLIAFTRTLGSSWIIGKGYHGVTGPTFGGILGSIIQSGINFLGDSRSALVAVYSGGYP